MNYILHIETSTKACSAGISLDGQLAAIRETNTDEFVHSELLTVYIEQLLGELAIEPKALAAVAVTSGPGSYTGLRIGVSTAKGLCYALQIPLIAVDALVSLNEQISEAQQNVCAVIDARRMEVFSAIYAPNGQVLKPISADVLDESSYAEFEPLLVVGDAVPKLKGLWAERSSIHFNDAVFSSVKGQIRLAYQKFLNQEFENVAYFEPFYLKDFVTGK